MPINCRRLTDNTVHTYFKQSNASHPTGRIKHNEIYILEHIETKTTEHKCLKVSVHETHNDFRHFVLI